MRQIISPYPKLEERVAREKDVIVLKIKAYRSFGVKWGRDGFPVERANARFVAIFKKIRRDIFLQRKGRGKKEGSVLLWVAEAGEIEFGHEKGDMLEAFYVLKAIEMIEVAVGQGYGKDFAAMMLRYMPIERSAFIEAWV